MTREQRTFGTRVLVRTFALSMFAFGCGGAVKESSLPGGGFVVSCEKGISSCINRAEVLCGDKGYTVVGGVSTSKVLGGATSAYRKVVYKGELSFYCGPYAPAPQCGGGAVSDETAVHQLSVAEAAPPALAASAPTRVCVPGATQACVGPGACAGGQICAADGLAFGACDCGRPQALAPSEAPPSSQAPTAAPESIR